MSGWHLKLLYAGGGCFWEVTDLAEEEDVLGRGGPVGRGDGLAHGSDEFVHGLNQEEEDYGGEGRRLPHEVWCSDDQVNA
jgi:hypothetical protein